MSETGGFVLPLGTVTLVLADTAVRSVFRTDDSVFVRLPRPLPGEHLLFTHIEVQAPPSGSTNRCAETAERNFSARPAAVDVRPATPESMK